MNRFVLSAAVITAAFSALIGCNEVPVQPVAVPLASDPHAYRPVPQQKPLPPDGYIPGMPAQQPPGGMPGMPGGAPAGGAPGGPPPGLTVSPNPPIQNEDVFVAAYAKRNPQIMIFVNRTIMGDPLPKENLEEMIHVGNAQYPAGVTENDYQMVELSLVRYFDNSGKIRVQDSEAARSKLNREQILRVENGDPAAARLLGVELQSDILIRVSAKVTSQAGAPAVRLLAKAVSTTDARSLGTAFVDMPLPMDKPTINAYTRHLAEELMRQMAIKWAQPAEYDPIEVRIYKAASIDDAGKIANWIKKAPGVVSVDLRSGTAGGGTSYAVVHVGFNGGPWALYQEIQDSVGMSQGLKAVDLQNNTVNLEITGPMNLVTTTRAVESTTTVETHTTEERRVEPVNPAPAPAPAPR